MPRVGFRRGAVRREIPRAENGKRCQTPSAPVLLFSCRRGPRTRRPRLRRNRGQTEPRGRPRKFLKCVPGHSAPRARQDGGGVLQAKDVQFLQRGRSEAHEGARSWKPHRVRGGDGGEGLRTPAASQSRRRRESGMTVSHEWLDKVFWLLPLTRCILAPPREINPHSPTSHRPPSGYLFFSERYFAMILKNRPCYYSANVIYCAE